MCDPYNHTALRGSQLSGLYFLWSMNRAVLASLRQERPMCPRAGFSPISPRSALKLKINTSCPWQLECFASLAHIRIALLEFLGDNQRVLACRQEGENEEGSWDPEWVKAYARLEQESRSRDESAHSRMFGGNRPRGSARDPQCASFPAFHPVCVPVTRL